MTPRSVTFTVSGVPGTVRAVRVTFAGSHTFLGNLVVHLVAGDDPRVSGDYDGDAKTDFGIWRASVTPGQSAFWVRRSSNGSTLIQQWGHNGDYAVANFIVH